MRLAWLTDIHLNFLEPEELSQFYQTVNDTEPEAILLTGDIAEGPHLVEALTGLADHLRAPLFFVLGNHDYYFRSIAQVRSEVRELVSRRPGLIYLTGEPARELAPGWGILGHDGWADARLGDYVRSTVMMHDYKLIAELAGVGKAARWPLLQQLADEAASEIRRELPLALARFPEVWLLTHVPPFAESCLYDGRPSDAEWLPHFACQTMGDALLEVMRMHPASRLTVLCGHTHGRAEYRPLENLLVLTGGAQYGAPRVERVFSV